MPRSKEVGPGNVQLGSSNVELVLLLDNALLLKHNTAPLCIEVRPIAFQLLFFSHDASKWCELCTQKMLSTFSSGVPVACAGSWSKFFT